MSIIICLVINSLSSYKFLLLLIMEVSIYNSCSVIYVILISVVCLNG